jgi:hypothetical protein
MENIMETYKTLISKLSLTAIALFFAAGCATVTDANTDLMDEPTEEITTMERAGDTWDAEAGNDLEPIIVKPVMTDGEW